MALLEIVTYPDPRLKKVCQPVEEVDEEIKSLISDMAETMYAAPGVGLAAPQVGELKRVLVCDATPKDQPRRLIALVNPEIVEEEGSISMEEGCLSCPEIQVEVPRAARIKVRGLDAEGRSVTLEAEDLLAVVLQHEIDHLDGGLIVDHLSSLKRNLYRRQRKKAKTEDRAA
ncbi:MAG: peptide deformylase [Deltaproteobacteria bacterium]|nr:peptide deformylase [Deltaproteobacteria bacterium]